MPNKIDQQLTEIQEKSSVTKEYSFVAYYVMSNFDEFVDNSLEELNEVERKVVKKAYKTRFHAKG